MRLTGYQDTGALAPSGYGAAAYSAAGQQLSRSAEARQFATQVVPAAVGKYASAVGANAESASYGAAATSASGAAAKGSLLGTTGTWLGTATTVIGALQGAYNLVTEWGRSTPAQGAASGMAVGAAIGSVIPGVGTAIGAAVGTLVGGLAGMVTAGKHKDQKVRDAVRSQLQQAGVIDQDYKLQLADGSLYDMGKDGGPCDEFGGLRPYEINYQDPMAKYAISWLNPLADLAFGGNGKVRSDFIGYLVNASLSNAKSIDDVRKNVSAIIVKFGVSEQMLTASVEQRVKMGQLPADVGAAYLNGIKERLGEVDVQISTQPL